MNFIQHLFRSNSTKGILDRLSSNYWVSRSDE